MVRGFRICNCCEIASPAFESPLRSPDRRQDKSISFGELQNTKHRSRTYDGRKNKRLATAALDDKAISACLLFPSISETDELFMGRLYSDLVISRLFLNPCDVIDIKSEMSTTWTTHKQAFLYK